MLATSPSQLASRAMLARVKICQWSATKMDKKVTDKVHSDNNAKPDAGRYNKRLVSKNALAEIVKIASEARAQHYARTSPWQDDGTRILSALGFDDYAATMQALRLDFDAAVASFVAGYPDFVMDARTNLNGMFNDGDYPHADSIASRFSFSVKIDPLSDAADFRVNISESQAADIRADIEARKNAAVAGAMRDTWERIADHVGKMAERLAAFKPAARRGEKSESIFRDSLVENVRELAGFLPSLNLTGDPALNAIADRMARELCAMSADELRDSPAARESVAKAAADIGAKVSEYLA